MALLLEKMVLNVWYIVEWGVKLDDWKLVGRNRGKVRNGSTDYGAIIHGRSRVTQEDYKEKGLERSGLLIFNVLYHKDIHQLI